MFREQRSDGVTVLVVEDDQAMLAALKDILEGAGYTVRTAPNGKAALDLLEKEVPALILSDIGMPVMNGIELMEAVRARPDGATIPFMFLTARDRRDDITAWSLRSDDYINKPIHRDQLLLAVRARLLRTDELQMAQLKKAYKATLLMLANSIEARDRYTRDHVQRVNAYSQALALELGWDEARRENLEFGAILHDIGKIHVDEAILTKPGPLTHEEWMQMQDHARLGASMLEGIDYLEKAKEIVLSHHERWDGSGYPEGIAGEDIPEEARLLAVADTFDAMTTDRPYRPAYPPDRAFAEISDGSGAEFDPRMVATFQQCWLRGDFHKIMEQYPPRLT